MSSDQTTVPVPYIVSPTDSWDGDDGEWSTFAIAAGTPPQTFRVLPSTVGEQVWLPATEGCEGALAGWSECGDQRGVDAFNGKPSGGFQYNASSSWSSIGINVLDTQKNLFDDPSSDVGLYGQDTVALGTTLASTGYGAPIKDQVIAAIATEDYWLGNLGLGIFDFTDTTPSLLVSMKAQNLTTSLSYGYTAGQSYASPKVPGSLILGGYDQARLRSSTVSMPINGTASVQELRLNVRNILASNILNGSSVEMIEDDIVVNVDSATSQFWLPETVCDSFADAFGLDYDNSTGLYLVNSTTHSRLQANPPSVTFTVGGNNGSTGLANIVLDYNAFDLSAGVPIYPNATPYFPIRRAANESQYTFGRTFLQEAYIIVDWERLNFTIGQTIAQNSTTNIVPLLPPSQTTSSSAAPHTETASPTPKKAPVGAIAGAVVAIIALLAIVAAVFLCLRRRRHRREMEVQQKHGSAESASPEYHAGIVENYLPEKVDGKLGHPNVEVTEIDYKRPIGHERKESELSDTQVYELEPEFVDRQLMSTPVNRELMSTPIVELEGDAYIASELDVGYGPVDEETPPETGAAMALSMSPVTPRLIRESIQSPRRFTLEDEPYDDESERTLRDRVVSEVSDIRSDCRSPDFSDLGLGEDSPDEELEPPMFLADIAKRPVVETEKPKDAGNDHGDVATPE